MTVHALHARASIKGHPIHAMLVGFPIALYTTGVAALVAYAIQPDLFWYRGAMTLLFLGVGIALVAAIFGAVDLFGIPRKERATRNTGFVHLGLNVVTTLLFAGAAFSLYAEWSTNDTGELAFALPLAIGAVALVLTFAAGALGWKLVQTHHVGVEAPAAHAHAHAHGHEHAREHVRPWS